jgi:hypothetical protein
MQEGRIFSVWAEFMVRVSVRGRVRVIVRAAVYLSVWTGFTVSTGKGSEHPRGMPLVTRLAARHLGQRRETHRHHRVQISVKKRAPYTSHTPMVLTLTQQNPSRKTRTVPPHPDGANPNAAESIEKNAHRTPTSRWC